jgi:hypothetical protein
MYPSQVHNIIDVADNRVIVVKHLGLSCLLFEQTRHGLYAPWRTDLLALGCLLNYNTSSLLRYGRIRDVLSQTVSRDVKWAYNISSID